MAGPLAHTPLFAWHASHGGRLVDFAGWEMPVQYTSIVAEHQATRTSAGIFDISHMGRLLFQGAGTPQFLDRLGTRRVIDMRPGQVRYSLITNEPGGILDDVLVYRLNDKSNGEVCYQVVVNASNRLKILDWIRRQNIPRDCQLIDSTLDTAMIAVQGPRAAQLLEPQLGTMPQELKYYHAREIELAGVTVIVSRTGYTGEDGWELIVSADHAVDLWQNIIDAGHSLGASPAGLGARDTLRLEAAMPLYGHELTEQINPFQAGLSFAVNFEGRSFPGHAALLEACNTQDQPVRVGWELTGRRVPREGYSVLAEGQSVGHVTSGTFSPTLDRPIAMGYCQSSYSRPGTKVSIDIRGRKEPARVVPLPFYRRPVQGISVSQVQA